MNTSADVAIIGGGIIGCTLAYDLTVKGMRVSLFERGGLAREASLASAGIISPPAPRFGALTELALLSFRRYPSLVEEIHEASGMHTGWNLTGETVLGFSVDRSAMQELADWQNEQGITAELVEGDALRDLEPAVSSEFDVAVYTPNVASVLLD